MSSSPKMWSAWQCVTSIASSHLSPIRSACWRKSIEASMSMLHPLCSTSTEVRRRLSRGSSDVHVSHSQPIEGTPVEVPVPSKVNFIRSGQQSAFSLLSSAGGQMSTALDRRSRKKADRRKLLSPRDVAAGEASSALRGARGAGQGDVLHAQLREDHVEELRLLFVEVAARLALQRAEHVYALACELEVDAAAARMVDHAERVRRERGEELDEHQEVFRAGGFGLRRRGLPDARR